MKYKINSEYDDVRLDRFLKKNCPNNSLSEIFSNIRKGKILVNNKKVKQNYRLKVNDEIDIINLDFNLKENKKYNNLNKELIFYEDKDIIIVDKPKGVAMHKGSKTDIGLSEMMNINFANRLDKKTSGLVIGCKNNESLRKITKLIRENKVIKKYKATSVDNGKYNIGDEFIIENKLLETENKVIISPKGKLCKTKYKVIDKKNNKIKLEIRLYTGRKHQIRVQLASLGLPILGDDKYSNYSKNDKLELDCYYLEFEGNKFIKK